MIELTLQAYLIVVFGAFSAGCCFTYGVVLIRR